MTYVPPALPPRIGRRAALGLGGVAAVTALSGCQDKATPSSGASATPTPTAPSGPADALARLREGNSRFAAGEGTHAGQDVAARKAVAEHQHPWALVHGCVDSRVTPEIVFDQGIGDLFTTRTAGAVLDDTIVGSMEFAASAPYAVPVIVILGHTGCGAVTAAVDSVASPDGPAAPGEVGEILDEIVPVARAVAPHSDKAEHVDAVVRANTAAVARRLLRRSAILRKAVRDGRLQVVPAVYDLGTGQVEWLKE